LPELKTVLPNAHFVIEGYVDPPSLHYGVTSPTEPLRDEGPFGAITHHKRGFAGLLRARHCGILQA
jgi:hypothetical protein